MSKKIFPDGHSSGIHERTGLKMTSTLIDQPTYSDQNEGFYEVEVQRVDSSDRDSDNFKESEISEQNDDTDREFKKDK